MNTIIKTIIISAIFFGLFPCNLSKGLLTEELTICSAQTFNLVWSQTNDHSTGDDVARGVAVDGTGLYVVGEDFIPGSTSQWRIEKRDLATGVLISGFGTGGVVTKDFSSNNDRAYGVAIDGTGLYVVGYDCNGAINYAQWHIEKFNLNTGSTIWSQLYDADPAGSDIAYGVAIDGTGLYVVGYAPIVSGDWRWYIQKRDLSTGTTIWTQTSNPSSNNDIAKAVTVDGTGVYVVGYAYWAWRIEKRDLNTGVLLWGQTIDPSGFNDWAEAVTLDGTGLYVVGNDVVGSNAELRMEKRNLSTGASIWTQTSHPGGVGFNDWAYGVSSDGSGIYVAGGMGTGGGRWYIEKRDLTTAALLCTYSVNPSAGWDVAYAITNDASGIYVAGKDNSPGNAQWRIEKYDGCGLSLPISILTFSAQWLDVTQTDALLDWSTASELNNSHFTLERSTDGINFTAIATIPGAGNSSSLINYQYTDNTLPEKTKCDVFYYRLKQTDFNGAFTYSKTEVLTRGSITVIDPAPNLINDELNFTLLSAANGEISITITNMLGQSVKNELRATHKGIQQIKIPLALASGMYLLHVTTSDGVERIQKEFVIK